ncbi:hypothetical protein B0H19DRAFT_1065267 [Mycena capillaripes]|nr:hypothetical protein B0H19DRAFT_1065267 [Mycena capillaripes]
MVSPTIPIELHERILDCLHGDIPTLKTCSFVCRAWKPSTRIHLFRRFNASYDASTDQEGSAFIYCRKYVEQALHLAEYIREIEIHVLLDDDMSETRALCVILDRAQSLQRVSISTFQGGFTTMRAWRTVSAQLRGSLSAALHRSSLSLSHILLDGFSWAVSDLELFRGMRRVEYVGIERMGFEDAEDDIPSTPISGDCCGTLHTVTLYFNFPDPGNGLLVASLVATLHAVKVSHITNLRLGGVLNVAVLAALPHDWLSNVTHLGLELTNLNPTHSGSPLSALFIAKVPAFRSLSALELSLNVYPSAVPHDLSALEIFLTQLLPTHRIASIITTVMAHGPPTYLDALRKHYAYCLSRADVVKVRWEDGKLEYLEPAFPELFADGMMEVGKFRQSKWSVPVALFG